MASCRECGRALPGPVAYCPYCGLGVRSLDRPAAPQAKDFASPETRTPASAPEPGVANVVLGGRRAQDQDKSGSANQAVPVSVPELGDSKQPPEEPATSHEPKQSAEHALSRAVARGKRWTAIAIAVVAIGLGGVAYFREEERPPAQPPVPKTADRKPPAGDQRLRSRPRQDSRRPEPGPVPPQSPESSPPSATGAPGPQTSSFQEPPNASGPRDEVPPKPGGNALPDAGGPAPDAPSRAASPPKTGMPQSPRIVSVDIVAPPDAWSVPVVLPPGVRFSIRTDGRIRIRNGDRLYFGDSQATLSMGEGLSRRFNFKSAEQRPVNVTLSYEE